MCNKMTHYRPRSRSEDDLGERPLEVVYHQLGMDVLMFPLGMDVLMFPLGMDVLMFPVAYFWGTVFASLISLASYSLSLKT
jgi:hypothetical protein